MDLYVKNECGIYEEPALSKLREERVEISQKGQEYCLLPT